VTPLWHAISPLLNSIGIRVATDSVLGMWITYIVCAGILAFGLSMLVAYSVLLERKVAGFIQERPGPNRAGPWGLLQPIADVAKLLFKEDIIHDAADKPAFKLAPFFAFVGPVMILVAVPFGPGIQMSAYATGLLMVLGFSGLAVIGILTGGYASNSKFSLIGGLRAASQMITYEVPLILAVLAAAMVAGSFELGKIVDWQTGGLMLAFVQPVGFILFLICMIAETNRTPFDIPEGESEITGGYHTEYSGIRFGMFFLGEYTALLSFSALGAVLFLGGWNGPPAIADFTAAKLSFGIVYSGIIWTAIIALMIGTAFFALRQYRRTGEFFGLVIICLAGLVFIGMHVAGSALGGTFLLQWPFVWLCIKIFFLVFVALLFRWTFLRLRVDQLTSFSWKFLFPLAIVNLFVTAILILLFEGK